MQPFGKGLSDLVVVFACIPPPCEVVRVVRSPGQTGCSPLSPTP